MKTSYKVITIGLILLFLAMAGGLVYLTIDNKDLKLDISNKEKVISEQDSKIKELLTANNLLTEDSLNKDTALKALEEQIDASIDNCKKTLSNLEQLYLIDEKVKKNTSTNKKESSSDNTEIKEYIKLRNKIYKTLK